MCVKNHKVNNDRDYINVGIKKKTIYLALNIQKMMQEHDLDPLLNLTWFDHFKDKKKPYQTW